MNYVSKPQLVEAVQYKGDVKSFKEVLDLLGFIPETVAGRQIDQMFLKIKFGAKEIIVMEGNYIIKGALGIIKVMNESEFNSKYELAEKIGVGVIKL